MRNCNVRKEKQEKVNMHQRTISVLILRTGKQLEVSKEICFLFYSRVEIRYSTIISVCN